MSSPLTEEQACQAMELAGRSVPDFPGGFEGRGIVIPAGGPRYFPSAYVGIRALREMGCQLPIEMWHLGSRELDDEMRCLIEPLGVRFVDALRVGPGPCSRPPGPGGGWELKAFSIIRSRFQQVLLLDADNLAVVDPTFLFDAAPFRRHGATFWPDYGRFDKNHPVWKLTGVDYRDEPEFESGQVLVDKQRCWKPLLLAGWMNEHSQFWYRHMLGDKDTFHLAWRKLGHDYAMPEREIESLDGVMCQHDFLGGRVFQHHNFHKWSVDAARVDIPGFLHLNRCFSYLDELRERWRQRPTRPYREESASAAEREAARQLCEKPWLLSRGGQDRVVQFYSDGRIEGPTRHEQTWNVVHNGFDAIVVLSGHEGVSCRMVRSKGAWRGRCHGRSNGPAVLERAPRRVVSTASQPATRRDCIIQPEEIRIAIPTVARQPAYVHTTLASLLASGPEIHRVAGLDLLIGAADDGYLDPYRHNERIQLHPMMHAEAQLSASWSVHRKACLNHYRCLRMPMRNLKGVCLCEDDIVFCDGFVSRLLQAVHEMEYEFGLQRYFLACYVPYLLDNPALRRGKHFSSYPAHSYYGAQCMYYPKSVAAELAERVLEAGVQTYTKPVDLIIRDYGIELNATYGTRKSLVQHIGKHTTGLGDFHSSPTFAGSISSS